MIWRKNQTKPEFYIQIVSMCLDLVTLLIAYQLLTKVKRNCRKISGYHEL